MKPSAKTKNRRRDSLMQVSGFLTSPYWGSLLPPLVTPSKRGQGQAPTEERHRRETKRMDTIPGPVGRPSDGAFQEPGASESVADSKGLSHRSKKRQRKKRGGFVDPAAWVSIQRSLLQQGQLSPSVSRDQALDEAPPPGIPSRSSSQRKALNHFIRELDKYATAAGAARRLPVITPTESASIVSLHTVGPLLPYLNEFQSAGLAVTSEQQKPKHLEASNIRRSSRYPPIGDDHNGSPKSKPSACHTSYAKTTPLDTIPTAVLESPSPLKPKHEGSRRKLPWLKPSTEKPELEQSITVAKSSIQVIKDGKIRSKWEEPPNFPATQEAESRSHSPLSRQHGRCVREMAHRDAIPDAPATASETHQPSTPFKRDMAIPQLPLPESAGGTDISIQRNHIACTLNKPPHRTDPGSWLSHLPSRRMPGKRFGLSDASPAPEIPITWNHAAGSGSSLERPLSAAIRDVGMKAADTGQQLGGVGQAKLTAETVDKQSTLENARRPDACTYDPQDHPATPHKAPSRANRPEKSVMKELNLPTTKGKWKAPEEPALQTTAHILPKSPCAEAAIRLPKGPEKDDRLTKDAENGTGSLSVSGYDHDDGNINDRDVLKGLQVAVQAAADEAFDTLIQDETGLRIRQFLADLKMVGGLGVATGDQRARPRRTMMSRLTRERELKPRAGSRT